MSLQKLTTDIPVGTITEGDLHSQVSVRGDVIVVTYHNVKTGKAASLTYSGSAAVKFVDLLVTAHGMLQGRT